MNRLFFLLLLAVSAVSCSKEAETVLSTILYGNVIDAATGMPVANVAVTLYEGLAWDCLGNTVAKIITGSDGYFQITDLDADKSYFIAFTHPDYQRYGQRVKCAAGKQTQINAAL